MSFEIRPVTAALGAEVLGLDLASLDDAGVGELRKLWLDYKVLFFRDQALSIEEHIAFGRRFGELEQHPFAPDLPRGCARMFMRAHAHASQPRAFGPGPAPRAV